MRTIIAFNGLILLVFPLFLNGQTQVSDYDIGLRADRTRKCKGDNTPITITNLNPFLAWYDRENYYNPEYCRWECRYTNVQNPQAQGEGIVFHSDSPNPSECPYPDVSYRVEFQVNPQQTTTYTISWTIRRINRAVNSCGINADESIDIFNYSGEVTIYVTDPPVPDLAILDPPPVPTNDVLVEVTNCDPLYRIMLKNSCVEISDEDYFFNSSYCRSDGQPTSFFMGVSPDDPNLPKVATYEVQFYTMEGVNGDEACKGPWSSITGSADLSKSTPDECADLEVLMNDYVSKIGSPESVYAHQYFCIANKTCEEYAQTGENGWAAGFVKYSFDWMESHTDRINGSDISCDVPFIPIGNSFCSLIAGTVHFTNELYC